MTTETTEKTVREELEAKTKKELREWADEHDVEIPEAIDDKQTILAVLLDSDAAALEHYRHMTVASIADQCARRGLVDEGDEDRVFEAVEKKLGGPIEKATRAELVALNRELDDVFVALLRGLRRKPGSRRRPAGL